MKYKRFSLNVDYSRANRDKLPNFTPALDAYLLDNPVNPYPRKAVIICPGGAYSFTAALEGEPVAQQFLSAGIQSFVLWYSTAPAVFPMSLMELATAVRFVRQHAAEWNIDPDGIAVLGFSAGGHLAASLANFWQMDFLNDFVGSSPEEIRPNYSILCYPVITSGPKAHRNSIENLCRGLDDDFYDFVSLENRVSPDTPPTFIWSTWTDDAVPVDNTLYYVDALYQNNISCEAHIFHEGKHGLSLGTDEVSHNKDQVNTYVGPWIRLCINWFLHF